jgi:hypothetical protein
MTAPGARDELLGGIASGTIRTAVVLDGFQLRDGKLYGGAEFVPDAEGADRLLVLADDTLALAPNGLIVNRSPWWTTRSLATVSADGAAAEVLGRVDVHALRDRAAVAIACDSLGVAQAMLDATVAYAKVRNQFGRPIGSFQAVKHACADMLVSIAVSRRLVGAAVAQRWSGAAAAASMAKAHVTSTAVEIAGKAMQLHGGIGYTWRAASTCTSNAPPSTVRCSARRQHTDKSSQNATRNQGVSNHGRPRLQAHPRPLRGRGHQHVVRHPGPQLRAHVHRGRGPRLVRGGATPRAVRGFMAEAASRMTGRPGLCIGTLGPGMANIAGAIQCALVENSPVIFLGGQRARVTERRVRRGRIQFVQQEPLFALR